jgi:protein-disulfide isomerase
MLVLALGKGRQQDMKRPPVKVILPVFLAALVIIVLVVKDYIPPRPSSDGSLIKIIVYTDFECGACGRLHSEVEPELRERYVATGKAQIEIRLLGAMSTDSRRAAEAALCAGDQGKLSEYTDALFAAYRAYSEGEDIDVFSAEALTSLAAELGLDEAAFANCLNSQTKEAQVEQNMNMAEADDVGCLPTVLVGDLKIECRQPLEIYIQAVEEALAAQPP